MDKELLMEQKEMYIYFLLKYTKYFYYMKYNICKKIIMLFQKMDIIL